MATPPMNLADADLLRAFVREGSESAFRSLTERHVDLVFGAALRRTGHREFLVSDDGTLHVRYLDQWGNRLFRNRSYNLEECNAAFQQAWDYGHLFGPGGPLDLQ
jgi:hypothetical protein